MITSLRAHYMYDPDGARDRIVEAFSFSDGRMGECAISLGVSYATLLRLIKQDSTLAGEILKERERLSAAGVHQRGFGPSHRASIDAAAQQERQPHTTLGSQRLGQRQQKPSA